jgi:hypothetical protein
LELLPRIVEQEIRSAIGTTVQMVPWFRSLKEKGESMAAYLKGREAYFRQYSATGRVVTMVSSLDGSDSLAPFYADEQRYRVDGDARNPVWLWVGCSSRSKTAASSAVLSGPKTADDLLSLRHFQDDHPLKLNSFLADHSMGLYIACARHLHLRLAETRRHPMGVAGGV